MHPGSPYAPSPLLGLFAPFGLYAPSRSYPSSQAPSCPCSEATQAKNAWTNTSMPVGREGCHPTPRQTEPEAREWRGGRERRGPTPFVRCFSFSCWSWHRVGAPFPASSCFLLCALCASSVRAAPIRSETYRSFRTEPPQPIGEGGEGRKMKPPLFWLLEKVGIEPFIRAYLPLPCASSVWAFSAPTHPSPLQARCVWEHRPIPGLARSSGSSTPNGRSTP